MTFQVHWLIPKLDDLPVPGFLLSDSLIFFSLESSAQVRRSQLKKKKTLLGFVLDLEKNSTFRLMKTSHVAVRKI